MTLTSRRFFLTGLAAGIAAPMILPRMSLMAMPRAPLIVPKFLTFGGARWNGRYYPTVQDALDAAMNYLGNDKGLLQTVEVYQSGNVWHPDIAKWRSPEQAGHVGNGDSIIVMRREAPFRFIDGSAVQVTREPFVHASPFKVRQDDGGFV